MGFIEGLLGLCHSPVMDPSLQSLMMNTGLRMQQLDAGLASQYYNMGMGQSSQMASALGMANCNPYAWTPPPSPPRPKPICIECRYCGRKYKITEAPDNCKGCGAPVDEYMYDE